MKWMMRFVVLVLALTTAAKPKKAATRDAEIQQEITGSASSAIGEAARAPYNSHNLSARLKKQEVSDERFFSFFLLPLSWGPFHSF